MDIFFELTERVRQTEGDPILDLPSLSGSLQQVMIEKLQENFINSINGSCGCRTN